jgi:hypothetical protein
MKALILNSQVVQIEETEFEVHEDLTWVDCDNTVEVGFTYDGSTFTDPTPVPTAEENLLRLRLKRNALLAETDWWASSDLTMTAEQTAYRQALRDITDTYTSLDDVVWPTKP